jgi:glycosyltransferase involved in cell wall biosynthesis
MDKVSVIIPTYNRFNYLLHTIASIKNQTHTNIEIIVVNDNSTQQEYYNYNWDDIIIIHLKNNTKNMYGFACAGVVRNHGIKRATGKYIAFCDDDDTWFPLKLELQLQAMKETDCKMSSTDGLIGYGVYDSNKKYNKHLSEYYYDLLKSCFIQAGTNYLDDGFPRIWDKKLLKLSNCMIASSVIIDKTIIDKIGEMKIVRNGEEDYDYWLRALEHTDSVFVPDVCVYYDNGHGDGRNY